MSEELLQRDLLEHPEKIGNWNFYNLGATTIKQLKDNGIINSQDYTGIENKKPDALITTENNRVVAMIENKLPSELKTKLQKQKAIKQEIHVAKKLTKLLIVTDTVESLWINALNGKEILDEKGNPLLKNFNKNDEDVIKLIKHINNSIDENNFTLKEIKDVDPSDLAKSIWQDVWSVSGATPENCLYTFVEIFIFKYLSDLGILKQKYSFDKLLEQYEEDSDEEVLEDYAQIIRPYIKTLFEPGKKDNTTIINGTIFVSKDEKAIQGYSTVFKKILFKFKEYGKLENINHDFKSRLFESFLKESISKKNWGQFFTPLKIVKSICKATEINIGMKICDPACGVGKFILEPIIKDLDKFYEIKNGKMKRNIEIFGFDKGFDRDEQKTIILAKANMLIYFSDLIKENPEYIKQFSDLFNDSFELKTNSILGTLSDPREEEFDLILTNPPYVTSGSSNIKDEIKKRADLQKYYKINAMGVEGLFMEWIIRSLKKGGKAFVVIPDGILNRTNDKNLRKFILDECTIDMLISLPKGTFFTTPKKTYILGITKKYDSSKKQENPIFTYLVSDIGESLDIYRFDTDNNQLDDSINLFNQFKGSKKYFKNHDERCKIFSLEDFEKNYEKGWIIDRWWTDEEKIKIGIKEEERTFSIQEFSNFIGEIGEKLNEYKEVIGEIENDKNKNL